MIFFITYYLIIYVNSIYEYGKNRTGFVNAVIHSFFVPLVFPVLVVYNLWRNYDRQN